MRTRTCIYHDPMPTTLPQPNYSPTKDNTEILLLISNAYLPSLRFNSMSPFTLVIQLLLYGTVSQPQVMALLVFEDRVGHRLLSYLAKAV